MIPALAVVSGITPVAQGYPGVRLGAFRLEVLAQAQLTDGVLWVVCLGTEEGCKYC